MFRTLLVPWDGSPASEHALPLAIGIARRIGASLRLVRVHVPQEHYQGEALLYEGLDHHTRAREQDELDRITRRVADIAAGVPVTSALVSGAVCDALIEHAAAVSADLIVMTTHGRGMLSRFWLGSVADELVRRSPVPLLLCRPTDAPCDLTSEPLQRRVLIALDGSPAAESIVEPAVALGSPLDAEYMLLQVVPPAATAELAAGTSESEQVMAAMREELQAAHERQREAAGAYLESIAADLRSRSLSVETRVVDDSRTAVAILDDANQHGADLIALATRGRGRLARLFLGSVADKVIRGAGVPVLVRTLSEQVG